MCAIGVSGALAAAGSFLFALPVARFGIFNRLEIVVIGLLLSGAACAVGLVGLRGGSFAARRALTSPIFWLLGGLAVWSASVAPLAEYPWRSFLGPPQTGQGVLALTALACIAAIVAGIGVDRRVRLGLAVASTVGAVTSALTHLAPESIRPFEVPGYFVLLGLAAAGTLASLELPRRQRYVLAAGVLALTLAVSENRTAFVVVFAIGVPGVWAAEAMIARGRASAVRAIAALACVVLPFLVTAVVWVAGSAGYGASIIARARIYDVLLAAFIDRPAAILVGFGWGGVMEAFFRHLPSGAELLYGNSWDVPVRDFHSAHNLALEFFVSAGLPGLAAAIALPMLVVLGAPRRALAAAIGFALSLAALSVVWHQQSFNLGPTIVSCVLLIGRPLVRRPQPPRRVVAGLQIAAFSGCAALLVGATWLTAYGWRAYRSLSNAGATACLADFPDDPARGDMGLRYALYGLTERIRRGDGPADGLARAAAISCAVDRRIAAAPSLHLALAGTLYRSEVAFDPRVHPRGDDLAKALRDWPDVLAILLATAPRRTDLAVPYFAWLAQTGDQVRLRDVTDKLLEKSPQDIVGLWFSGVSMIGSPDVAVRRSAARRMAASLAGGFDRILPVSPETRAQIRLLM